MSRSLHHGPRASDVRLLLAYLLCMMGAAAAVLSGSVEPLGAIRTAVRAARSNVRMAVVGPQGRCRRAISSGEISALLEQHNRVRSQVFPPAANMEYMLWDEGLAKSADLWASRCIWDHGPPRAMSYLGQNLLVTMGRYQSITELIKSWSEERHHFSFPNRCRGSVCSHYTQMVWASSNRVGCAIRKCSNMLAFGSTWREVTLLVCNYSIKGNWVGEAPYQPGRPCSVCPSNYAGSCWKNQCLPNGKTKRLPV